MAQITAAGALNTTALVVPDLYVQIVPPNQLALNGVPTNRLGVVGTASWGPVGRATIAGNYNQYQQNFGPVMNRKYDMGTQVAVAVQQGAADFRCVRVTDGTDLAATAVIVATCFTLTGLYTGSLGNSISAIISTGSKVGSFKLVVGLPGLAPEVYDNITGTGNAFWVALAAAVNNGTNQLRGPSQIVVASAGVGTTAPVAQTAFTFLAGGVDGVSTLTAATLIGVDAVPRKGMYALRQSGCSVCILADTDDSTQYTTQDAFGLSEGMYMILTGPSGDTIANAVTTKAAAGLDDYASKLMFGDWIFWNDPINAVLRLVSPQAFVGGLLSNLSPQNSTLNKLLASVVATQKSGLPGSGQQQTYTTADLTALFQVGIDVITNPVPGGNYWGVRGGFNASSNATINGDNYTRMTNYIAATLAAGMGPYVGQVINTALFQNVRGSILGFLGNLLQQGILGSTTGALPYSVVCDISNNPFSRTSLDYLQADVAVQYQAINAKFIINLQGGQTIVVQSAAVPLGA